MKKLMILAVIAMVLTVFNGCQKDGTDLLQKEQKSSFTDPMFAGLDSIAFSVDNNVLAFESQMEYEKCLDFLAQLGDENFPAFEKEIGFESYRSKYQDDPEMSEVFIDDMFKTILNPEMQVVIGTHLFTEMPDKQRTLISDYSIEKDCSLKSAGTNSNLEVGWHQDAFAVLNGSSDIQLKSGCSNSNYNGSTGIVYNCRPPVCQPDYIYSFSWTNDLNFQRTSIFKSIIAKVTAGAFGYSDSQLPEPYPCPISFKLYFNSIGKATYDRKNKNQFCDYVSAEKMIYLYSGSENISWRPFYGSRQVNCYNVIMDMGIQVVSGARAPQSNGEWFLERVTLQCNENDSHCSCN